MPTKKRSKPRRRTVAQAKRRRARRNPVPGAAVRADVTSFAIDVGVGFAGYAGTRLLSRGVAQLVSKKSPKLAKHAGVIGSAATFGAAFFALPAIKQTEKHAGMALFGSGIALLQNVFRTYAPKKYSWIVGDYHADIGVEAAPKAPELKEPEGEAVDYDEDVWEPGMQMPADMQGTRLPGDNGKTEDDFSDVFSGDLGSLGYGGDAGEMALAEYGAD